jgi:hypothetical protein
MEVAVRHGLSGRSTGIDSEIKAGDGSILIHQLLLPDRGQPPDCINLGPRCFEKLGEVAARKPLRTRVTNGCSQSSRGIVHYLLAAALLVHELIFCSGRHSLQPQDFLGCVPRLEIFFDDLYGGPFLRPLRPFAAKSRGGWGFRGL